MNTKEFVTKIILEPIRAKQRRICGISLRKKMVLPGIIALISFLTGNPIAYAQTIGEHQLPQVNDPFIESLNVAKTKVEAATSIGAFGPGVPELYNITVQDRMLAFSITAIGAFVTYIAVRMLSTCYAKMKTRHTNILQSVV